MAAAATPCSWWAWIGARRRDGHELRGDVPRWVPQLYVLLQLAAVAWASVWVLRPQTSFLEATGLAVSAGVTMGVFGFLAAHEMIHSRDQRERALGLLLLATVFYMHFASPTCTGTIGGRRRRMIRRARG